MSNQQKNNAPTSNENKQATQPVKKKRYEGLNSFCIILKCEEYVILTALAERYHLHRTEVVRRLLDAQGSCGLRTSDQDLSGSSATEIVKKKSHDEPVIYTIRFQRDEYAAFTQLAKRQDMSRKEVLCRLLKAQGALHGICGHPQEKELKATA